MAVRRYLFGSALGMLLVACDSEKLPLGEHAGEPDESDSGAGTGGSTNGAGGTIGSGGISGSGANGGQASGGSVGSGGKPSDCQPTAEICFGNRPASSPGNECLANIDNTGKSRVEFRQTWARDVAPIGLTSQSGAYLRAEGTEIRLPECHSLGPGGEILISSWDRSNPDITQQTLTSGFASYPLSEQGPDVVDEGFCFAEFSYTYSGQVESPAVAIDRWSNLTEAQPWRVAPTVYHRVAADFAAETLFDGTAQGDSKVFIDENAGYMHSYTPRMLMATLGSPSSVAVPMYAVETKWQFNDSTFNCMGRYRGDALNPDPRSQCGLATDDGEPKWGCAQDADCPPNRRLAFTTPNAGPGYTTGFVLIVDLERVVSPDVPATLCVTYPGVPAKTLVAEGWAALDQKTTFMYTCRGAPKWNPDLPDDAGLPMGDWCSRTNAPATATCHDAYRREFYSAAQAFKVREGTCRVAP